MAILFGVVIPIQAGSLILSVRAIFKMDAAPFFKAADLERGLQNMRKLIQRVSARFHDKGTPIGAVAVLKDQEQTQGK